MKFTKFLFAFSCGLVTAGPVPSGEDVGASTTAPTTRPYKTDDPVIIGRNPLNTFSQRAVFSTIPTVIGRNLKILFKRAGEHSHTHSGMTPETRQPESTKRKHAELGPDSNERDQGPGGEHREPSHPELNWKDTDNIEYLRDGQKKSMYNDEFWDEHLCNYLGVFGCQKANVKMQRHSQMFPGFHRAKITGLDPRIRGSQEAYLYHNGRFLRVLPHITDLQGQTEQFDWFHHHRRAGTLPGLEEYNPESDPGRVIIHKTDSGHELPSPPRAKPVTVGGPSAAAIGYEPFRSNQPWTLSKSGGFSTAPEAYRENPARYPPAVRPASLAAAKKPGATDSGYPRRPVTRSQTAEERAGAAGHGSGEGSGETTQG